MPAQIYTELFCDLDVLWKADLIFRSRTDLVQRKGSPMPLINLVVILVVVGVLLWLINNYVPMDGKIKNILNTAKIVRS